jgi:predicted peptidase
MMTEMNTFQRVALAAFFLAIYAHGIAKATDGIGAEDWVDLYEPHADDEMPYRLMKPMRFDASKSYPVIVSLHGGGGRGTDNRKQLRGWNKLLADQQRRSDYPCYVLAPQANRLWDAAHLKQIKHIVAALPSVDMDRIYVLGHFMGTRTRFARSSEIRRSSAR